MNVRFKNPPINELVIGAYFDPPLLALRSEHIGLFWERLRDIFPTVEQREPLSGVAQSPGPGGVVTISNEFLPMPRYWFVSEDNVNLIQVQKNAFLLNWRSRDTDYPHFTEHLKPNFDKYYGIFERFLREDVGEQSVRIGLCELTYVDLIEPCTYWQGPQDTSNVIPSFVLPDCGLGDSVASAFNTVYRYELGPRSQLHVAIRTTEAANEPDSPRLVLEFKALGHLGGVPKSDTASWYSEAHDAIVSRFLNMTSKDVQRIYWLPEDVSA